MIVNYQKELDKITGAINQRQRPSLLLHSCCAPCSSYCMEYLREYFDITVLYYNPNISSEPEYRKRLEEEVRLIGIYNDQVTAYRERGEQPDAITSGSSGSGIAGDLSGDRTSGTGIRPMVVTDNTSYINIIRGDYEPDRFYEAVRGYETCPEGGDRCFICYELRIAEAYRVARERGDDYVTTTLTISPLKNAARINGIGMRLEEAYAPVRWLPSDFKKKEGFKRSTELSNLYGLYRQNYCGCVFSRPAAAAGE